MEDFYVNRAKTSFLNCYWDDPNVAGVDVLSQRVRVRLWDIDDGFFPTAIDGVPFEYVQVTPVQEAS